MKLKGTVMFLAIAAAAECRAEGLGQVEAMSGVQKLGGYAEGWFYADSSDLSGLSPGKGADNGFRLKRARLAATGEINDSLSYRVGIGLDGPATGASASTARLFDAWMEYKASEALRAAFGQHKYEFTLEGAESTPDRVPVLRSEVTNELAGKLGVLGGTFRDIGLKVSGAVKDAGGLKYALSVINGSGMNSGDNNAAKDIVGRVVFEPLSGFFIGASGYIGKSQNQGAAFDVTESAWGLEARYSFGGVKLRAEYAAGRWENWDVAASAASFSKTQEPWGWYAQGSYVLPFLKSVELMGRYEYFEKDRKTAGSGLEVATMGVSCYLKGKTRLSANYLFRSPEESPIVTAQETNAAGAAIGDMFLAQALIAF